MACRFRGGIHVVAATDGTAIIDPPLLTMESVEPEVLGSPDKSTSNKELLVVIIVWKWDSCASEISNRSEQNSHKYISLRISLTLPPAIGNADFAAIPRVCRSTPLAINLTGKPTNDR